MFELTVGIDRTVLVAVATVAAVTAVVELALAFALRRWRVRGKRERYLAAVEGELARIAMGEQGLDELEALAILALQRDLLQDAEHVERVFDALGRVRGGLGVARKWMIIGRENSYSDVG